VSDGFARYGAIAFLGVPLVCYLAQAFLVYRPVNRVGMTMMMVGYAFALVGQYLDTKGI
jgi:hypothetical protein